MEDFRQRTLEEAHQFNIFRLLRMERREVETHSRLLTDLLDRDGSHGQGDIFVRGFWAMLERKCGDIGVKLCQTAPASWGVKDELYFPGDDETGARRFDIVLRGEPEFLLVIENKIGTVDSTRQIQDYLKLMTAECPSPASRLLIYLTPGGSQPGDFKWIDERVHLEEDRLICLSYSTDVVGWLSEILPEVQAEKVRQTLMQYIELADSLGGVRGMNHLEHPITDFLTRPDNREAVAEILQQVEGGSLLRRLREDFVRTITAESISVHWGRPDPCSAGGGWWVLWSANASDTQIGPYQFAFDLSESGRARFSVQFDRYGEGREVPESDRARLPAPEGWMPGERFRLWTKPSAAIPRTGLGFAIKLLGRNVEFQREARAEVSVAMEEAWAGIEALKRSC